MRTTPLRQPPQEMPDDSHQIGGRIENPNNKHVNKMDGEVDGEYNRTRSHNVG